MQLSEAEFMEIFGQSLQYPELLLNRYSHLIDADTKTYLLHKMQPLLTSTDPQKQNKLAIQSIGMFRFLAKVHKQVVPCPVRKIEVDTGAVFSPIAD